MNFQLPPVPQFDPYDQAAAQRWPRWKSRFENYLLSCNVTVPKRKLAILLHVGGEQFSDLYVDVIQPLLPSMKPKNEFISALEAFDKHFAPSANVELQRFELRQMRQGSLSFSQFYQGLRAKASLCVFANPDDDLRSQIITGTSL